MIRFFPIFAALNFAAGFADISWAQNKSFKDLWKQYGGQVKELDGLGTSPPKTGSRKPKATTKKRPDKPEFDVPKDINFGDYWALVIGIDRYQKLPRLKTAVADAKAVAGILQNKYGFKVVTLVNPTRDDLLDALDDLRSRLLFKDNFLIYYAGHGWLDDKADQGFWLPADAEKNRRSRWVANASITGTLRAIEAKHVMVIADSCYSGRLVRGVKLSVNNDKAANYFKRMSGKKARVVMTSGGLEPVEDGKGGHSPFARAFMRALNENRGVMDGAKLFNTIRRPVMVNANQTPQYSDLHRAGHDGGDFLFVRRR